MFEITDPYAPSGHDPTWSDETIHDRRPNHTVQDWIAMGNEVGELEITPLFWLKPTTGENCPSKSCVLCSTDDTPVQEFAQAMRRVYRENLREWGVEWDPTITF